MELVLYHILLLINKRNASTPRLGLEMTILHPCHLLRWFAVVHWTILVICLKVRLDLVGDLKAKERRTEDVILFFISPSSSGSSTSSFAVPSPAKESGKGLTKPHRRSFSVSLRSNTFGLKNKDNSSSTAPVVTESSTHQAVLVRGVCL